MKLVERLNKAMFMLTGRGMQSVQQIDDLTKVLKKGIHVYFGASWSPEGIFIESVNKNEFTCYRTPIYSNSSKRSYTSDEYSLIVSGTQTRLKTIKSWTEKWAKEEAKDLQNFLDGNLSKMRTFKKEDYLNYEVTALVDKTKIKGKDGWGLLDDVTGGNVSGVLSIDDNTDEYELYATGMSMVKEIKKLPYVKSVKFEVSYGYSEEE